MAYSPGTLIMLENWIGSILPSDGSMLEFGCQDLNPEISNDQIRSILEKIHGREFSTKEAESTANEPDGSRRLYFLFRNSPIECFYVDLYGDECGIIADLNDYQVPEKYLLKFDLVTNLGTSEHIFNQACAFKCMHDFTKVGGYMFHTVPFSGYYNHGLFNYHPIFFLFLANANQYKLVNLSISYPHFPYTIPLSPAIKGAEEWKGKIIDSGTVNCLIQKTNDKEFNYFTDFDRASLSSTETQLQELTEVLEWRYDLRIRE